MTYWNTNTPTRQAAVNALAIVGFIALIVAGISLAIYSTRFVPRIVNSIGAAAVYVGTVFTPSPTPTLSVVGTGVSSTTIPFGSTASSTASAATTSPSTNTVTPNKKTVGTGVTYTPPVTQKPVAPHGLSDLAVSIDQVGYITTAGDFVATTTIPSGYQPAVKFTIANDGTNYTGTWDFAITIPSSRSYLGSDVNCARSSSGNTVCTSGTQPSIGPGDSYAYTFYFQKPYTGANQTITITANPNSTLPELSVTNNTASAVFSVL